MLKPFYNVIGVMSGTSLDGLDLAQVHFQKTDQWHFEIKKSSTVPYSKHWRTILGKLTESSVDELKHIDAEYTKLLSEIISDFISKNSIENIDAICSHGHTALHQPESGLTYQIGNLPELAILTNQRVVCDFRTQDVKYGGQGAPLVPIGDELLFSKFDSCLNLGGFANVSFSKDGNRIAYDICPVNIVLNKYANYFGKDYDSEGQIARTGDFNQILFNELNALQYYQLKAPKSLGLEWVQNVVFPLILNHELSAEDVLRTFTEHISFQLSQNFEQSTKILVTGGGAHNDYLIELLQNYKDLVVEIPSKKLVEYKEALIFAFLGVLRLRNEINCLSTVTGAVQDHSSGVVFEP